MNIMPRRTPVNKVLTAAFVLGIAACTTESVVATRITSPDASAALSKDSDKKLDICHNPDGNANVINTSTNAWPAHRGDGDYALDWYVDHANGNLTGDGIHFTRISDALAAADSTRRNHQEKTAGACRITVHVAAGDYAGSFVNTGATLERLPILVVVPDVGVIGAYAMHVDADGRATGTSNAGSSAILSRCRTGGE
jgi:hypothetical protein